MPNWSHTYYTLTGDTGQIKELHGIMSELEGIDEPNYCPRWLGLLVERLGGDIVRVPCRGSWSDLEHRNDDSLCFSITHAWRHPEYLEDLIRCKFDKLNIYYQEQELDGGIFTSNDLQGEHYPETVLLDAGGNIDYFVGEDAFAVLSKISGQTISTWKEAFDLVDSDDDMRLLEIEYDQHGSKPREVKFHEFDAEKYKEFLQDFIRALSDGETESAYLQWGQEGFLGSGGCAYGSPDGGKDRLLSAVGHIPAEDIEGIYLTWDGGYVKTKALPKGKYLCTVNIYKQ